MTSCACGPAVPSDCAAAHGAIANPPNIVIVASARSKGRGFDISLPLTNDTNRINHGHNLQWSLNGR
jgi:hypothetical protein